MAFEFKKATKLQAKARLALQGPAGAGKTFSALAIGTNLGERVALVDTEHGSASKYSGRFGFDVLEVTDDYNPAKVGQIIAAASAAGYDVLVFDSLTHFWNGPGGFLELVDQEVQKQKARGGKPDSFAAWKVVDPIYRRMVQALLSAPMHVIVTLRAKTEYAREDDGGRAKIKKLGLAPEIRDNFQYEMDIEGMMDVEHHLSIGKTRCDALDGKVFHKPGKDVADILRAWLSDGAPAPAPTVPLPTEQHQNGNGVIAARCTDADRRQMIAALKQGQHSKADAQHWLLQRYGVESTAHVLARDVPEILVRFADPTPLAADALPNAVRVEV